MVGMDLPHHSWVATHTMVEPHSGGMGTIQREFMLQFLVEVLSMLLSGCSRLSHSDGRADHRTYTRRLVRKQLDRFSYAMTATYTEPLHRVKSRSAQQQTMSRLAISLAAKVYYHICNAGVRAMQILMTRITYIFSLAFYLNKEKDESVRSTAGTPMTKNEKNKYGSEFK